MEPKVLVILGSARTDSNTFRAIRRLCPFKQYNIVDLLDYHITNYSYDQGKTKSDDFTSIVEKILRSDIIIFATPVYWYSMSGHMKVFFDRLTDLLGKPTGRALKGKRTYLIASGGNPTFPEGFEVPFRETSNYLGMQFVKSFYDQVV